MNNLTNMPMLQKNCSSIIPPSLPCGCNLTSQSHGEETSTSVNAAQSEISAFMYIVVVLSFYALSMVLLMIKYIKREREEAVYDNYFMEYVKRDSFNDKTKLQDRKQAKRNVLLKYLVGSNKRLAQNSSTKCEASDNVTNV